MTKTKYPFSMAFRLLVNQTVTKLTLKLRTKTITNYNVCSTQTTVTKMKMMNFASFLLVN